MAKQPADSDEMVVSLDAVAEDTVAGSDCAGLAARETTVSCVTAVSDDDDIVDMVEYLLVEGVVPNDLEVVQLITCR